MSAITNDLMSARAAAGSDSGEAVRREQIATAAREFEAMFLLQMLKQMRQSVLGEEAREPGLGAETMTETFDVELSRHLSGRPGGLSDVVRRAFESNTAPAVSPTPPAAAPMPAPEAAAALRLPEGRVTSGFGWRADPIAGNRRFHRGVDVAAAYGTEVEAAAPGRVEFAGTQRGYGKTIVVEHEDGVRTRYAHLSEIGVARGETVAAGAVVGRVGKSGRATGPHLHFEVQRGGRTVDPMGAQGAAALKVGSTAADYPTGTARDRAVLRGVGE